MDNWNYTRVWQIDHKLVVAPTIEAAIALFKTYMGEYYHDEPLEIRGIGTNALLNQYDAIIAKE